MESVKYSNGGWGHISDVVERYCSQSLELIQKAEDLSRPTSIGSFHSESSVEMIMSPSKPSFSRRNSNDSSETESETSGKRSRLEKIVRGLAKLGGSSSSKKVYGSEWNVSLKKVYSPDSSKRFEWSSSNEDVKMRNNYD